MSFKQILEEIRLITDGISQEHDGSDEETRSRILALRKSANAYLEQATLEEAVKIWISIDILDRAFQDCVALNWITHPAHSLIPKGGGVQ